MTTNEEKRQTLSVLLDMATRYGMEPAAFEATVRATCSPTGKDSRPLTREEFAAFLLVAKQYGLNPLTKEIYAYPRRDGGIVPVVSVDGWINLINSHPQCDGWETIENHDEKGGLVSVTTIMHRKDRKVPTTKTEYLAECVRDTIPWKMKHRMLGHKSLIQCGRQAFGFAGIQDDDEARDTIANEAQADRVRPPAPPPMVAAGNAALAIEHKTPMMVINGVPLESAGTVDVDRGDEVIWTETEVVTAEWPKTVAEAIAAHHAAEAPAEPASAPAPVAPPKPLRPPPPPPRPATPPLNAGG
jgi:hypothetical protein